MESRTVSTKRAKSIFLLGTLLSSISFCVVWKHNHLSGKDLNKLAWEASFKERKIPVPSSLEPREGWGMNYVAGRPKPLVIPGRVSLDKDGIQYWGESETKLMVLGGSVAWGVGNSSNCPWSCQISKSLSIQIINAAIPGRASAWEVKQYEKLAKDKNPQFILAFDGLNDIAQTQGKQLNSLDKRIDNYFGNIRKLASLCKKDGRILIVSLQPSLMSKPNLSPIEKRILNISLEQMNVSYAQMSNAYQDLKEGLQKEEGWVFIDTSSLFQDRYTTFMDFWHFPDPGQKELAEFLTKELKPITKVNNI